MPAELPHTQQQRRINGEERPTHGILSIAVGAQNMQLPFDYSYACIVWRMEGHPTNNGMCILLFFTFIAMNVVIFLFFVCVVRAMFSIQIGGGGNNVILHCPICDFVFLVGKLILLINSNHLLLFFRAWC